MDCDRMKKQVLDQDVGSSLKARRLLKPAPCKPSGSGDGFLHDHGMGDE